MSENRRLDLARRVTWLMLARTVVTSLVLGLALWTAWAMDIAPGNPASVVVLAVIGTTYASTIVYGLLLRARIDPERLVWPQLVGDLAITAVLVHVTGGAQSAYTFFFALSIVGAAVVRSRRTTLVVTAVCVALTVAVALSAWTQALPLPTLPPLRPQDVAVPALLRDLGLSLGALAGVGALGTLLAGELSRTEASLASERRVVADLVNLQQDIVRSLPSGLLTSDLDGRVLSVNARAAELLPGAAPGADIEQLLPGLRALAARGGSSLSIRRADLQLERDGQALTLGVSVSPLRDVGDRVVGQVVNFTDLTELRRMEGRIRQAERLATLGELTAGIAHEIRNPLASISGSIELLRSAPTVSEDDRALMAIVTREVDRLDALIRELLDYASPRPREAVDLELGALLAETVTVFRQAPSRSHVTVSTVIPNAPVMVHADPLKLRQVFWNLLGNAADAAAAGGGRVDVLLAERARTVELSVVDDGPGISPDALPRIFDPFFTTKPRGTGLGLAICHNVVEEHGGTLEVDSRLGRGTRMLVSLPRLAPGAAASTPSPPSTSRRTAEPSEPLQPPGVPGPGPGDAAGEVVAGAPAPTAPPGA